MSEIESVAVEAIGLRALRGLFGSRKRQNIRI